MAIGPGKYDDLCTQVREQTEAEGQLTERKGNAV
jgi:hypothetical protein